VYAQAPIRPAARRNAPAPRRSIPGPRDAFRSSPLCPRCGAGLGSGTCSFLDALAEPKPKRRRRGRVFAAWPAEVGARGRSTAFADDREDSLTGRAAALPSPRSGRRTRPFTSRGASWRRGGVRGVIASADGVAGGGEVGSAAGAPGPYPHDVPQKLRWKANAWRMQMPQHGTTRPEAWQDRTGLRVAPLFWVCVRGCHAQAKLGHAFPQQQLSTSASPTSPAPPS